MATTPPEARESLWALITGPMIWAMHFVLSYVTAAVWCAKFADVDGSLAPVASAVAVYTLVALMLIALSAHRGFRRHSYGESAGPPHGGDTPGDRHRFLGFASLLLCALSAVAVVYGAMTVMFIRSCT
ncbi:MAG: hypothetical protein ACPHN2_00155 [Sinimarinibacterium flocculans]|uniref:hypothetical protein n=1 Tax=Sinimarinibacterium flocculans TaxID=985250 RepID=UPI003C51BEB5